MGEKVLDRGNEIRHRYPPTIAAALTESSRRAGIDLWIAFVVPAHVFPQKYRSERRKDQLQADKRLLIVASALFADHPNNSLERWNAVLLPLFNVPVWDFPTAKIKTSIQQVRPP